MLLPWETQSDVPSSHRLSCSTCLRPLEFLKDLGNGYWKCCSSHLQTSWFCSHLKLRNYAFLLLVPCKHLVVVNEPAILHFRNLEDLMGITAYFGTTYFGTTTALEVCKLRVKSCQTRGCWMRMREHKGTAAEYSTVQAAVFTHLAAMPLYVTLQQRSRFRQVSEELSSEWREMYLM